MNDRQSFFIFLTLSMSKIKKERLPKIVSFHCHSDTAQQSHKPLPACTGSGSLKGRMQQFHMHYSPVNV